MEEGEETFSCFVKVNIYVLPAKTKPSLSLSNGLEECSGWSLNLTSTNKSTKASTTEKEQPKRKNRNGTTAEGMSKRNNQERNQGRTWQCGLPTLDPWKRSFMSLAFQHDLQHLKELTVNGLYKKTKQKNPDITNHKSAQKDRHNLTTNSVYNKTI